jgi:hypothetical protein
MSSSETEHASTSGRLGVANGSQPCDKKHGAQMDDRGDGGPVELVGWARRHESVAGHR